MKKIIIVSVLVSVALIGSMSLVSKAAQPVGGEVPLYLLLQSYCKPGQVVYTEWSKCDKRFGKNGLQWRQIVRPTFNGCVPSVYDQLSATRECVK